MLPKEEKKVKDEEVVVRHGGGDRGLPLALEGALQDVKTYNTLSSYSTILNYCYTFIQYYLL